jgi:predicted 3-demethylubiquinone-9 3-methyltransferase (glyoxalase superfamily)
MQRIAPFLWFDHQAEEAVNFYTSIFEDSKIGKVLRYGDAGPGPKGSVMTASFTLAGQEFTALNGGPMFKFTEAVSFVVNCETQAEVDRYWERLVDGGTPQQCGWLKDRYGVSWQVVPTLLPQLMQDPDPARARRVTEAMMKMVKIDLATLQRAADGG